MSDAKRRVKALEDRAGGGARLFLIIQVTGGWHFGREPTVCPTFEDVRLAIVRACGGAVPVGASVFVIHDWGMYGGDVDFSTPWPEPVWDDKGNRTYLPPGTPAPYAKHHHDRHSGGNSDPERVGQNAKSENAA